MADFAVSDILAEIDRQAPAFGVDPRVAKAFVTAENTGSGSTTSRATYSGAAVSPKNALGVMQVIPSTARGLQAAGILRPDWKHDPTNLPSQIEAGLAAMKDMQTRQADPNDYLELAAMYNGGNYNQRQYRAGSALSPETAAYLPKVQRAYLEFGGTMTPQQIERAASQQSSQRTSPNGIRTTTASNGTSTRSNIYDPAAMDAFLTSAGNMLSPGGVFEQAQDAVLDRGSAVAGAGADLIQSIAQTAEATGLLAKAETVTRATDVATRAAILTRANLHPDQMNNRMDQALAAIDSTSAELDRLRPEIDARSAVGFFDNPLEWIVNQTRLPGMIGEYNNLVQVQQDAIGKYDAARGITAGALNLGTALSADNILAEGAAKADAVAAKAVEDQKKVQLQLAGKSAADAMNAVQLGMQQTNMALGVMNATKATQVESESKKTADQQKLADEAAVSDLNNIIKAAGGAGIDMARFKQLPAAERAQLMQATSGGKFGKDLASSLAFIDEYGNLGRMGEGGQLATVQWVQKSMGEANDIALQAQQKATQLNDKTFNPQKAKMAALQTVGAQYQTQAEGDMRKAAKGNPFKLDYTVQAKAPELASNVWAADIVKHGPGGPEQLYDVVDEQQLFNRARFVIGQSADPAAAIKRYAADIGQFYKTATLNQAKETRYPLFGLNKPTKTYPVHLPQMMDKATDTLDLGNTAAVESFLTRQYARSSRMSFSNAAPGGPFSLIN